MKRVIRLTENDLTNIVKRVINENITPQEKLLKKIDSIGLVETIKLIGYDGFDKILPDYFSEKENKVKLINEISENEEGGLIHLYEVLGQDIEIGDNHTDEGYEVEYISRIDGGYAVIETFLYEEDGEMYDTPTPVNTYSIYLLELNDIYLNIIFEGFVNFYLNP